MQRPHTERTISATVESWPLAKPFVISRGTKREAVVVVCEVREGAHVGRGEAVPYSRYNETIDGVIACIEGVPADITRAQLRDVLPTGAARCAVDCALWDLEAKATGQTCASMAGLSSISKVETAFTLSLGSPEEMADAALAARDLSFLKLKLGGGDLDASRMRAVRAARPDVRLVADANEAWGVDETPALLGVAAELGYEVIEQPIAVELDGALAGIERPVCVCADESVHVTADLEALKDRYDGVNIKLDKAGGLTSALEMVVEARRLGFKIMVGSMVATSLSMAPAIVVAQQAEWVDLDGPLLLARDRADGLEIANGWISPPLPALWG